jgi:16S rRNA (uracil1498-N3)-methyltransferase
VTLDRDETHHLLHVHRAEAGASFEATDGGGTLYRCRLLDGAESGARGEIIERVANAGELPTPIRLLIGQPSAPAAEAIVEHAVPLGVAAITFVGCRQSSQPPPNASRLERLARIALAGLKQSRRTRLPLIDSADSLEEALSGVPSGARFVADPNGGPFEPGLMDPAQSPINLAVGPPGGFHREESLALREAGFVAIALGPSRLTTETAAIALLSVLRNALAPGVLRRI